jgi:hypothetical protein
LIAAFIALQQRRKTRTPIGRKLAPAMAWAAFGCLLLVCTLPMASCGGGGTGGGGGSGGGGGTSTVVSVEVDGTVGGTTVSFGNVNVTIP